jgi:hypothetical protein
MFIYACETQRDTFYPKYLNCARISIIAHFVHPVQLTTKPWAAESPASSKYGRTPTLIITSGAPVSRASPSRA